MSPASPRHTCPLEMHPALAKMVMMMTLLATKEKPSEHTVGLRCWRDRRERERVRESIWKKPALLSTSPWRRLFSFAKGWRSCRLLSLDDLQALTLGRGFANSRSIHAAPIIQSGAAEGCHRHTYSSCLLAFFFVADPDPGLFLMA